MTYIHPDQLANVEALSTAVDKAHCRQKQESSVGVTLPVWYVLVGDVVQETAKNNWLTQNGCVLWNDET